MAGLRGFRKLTLAAAVILLVGTTALLAACSGQEVPTPTGPPEGPAARAAPTVKALRLSPEKGPVGTAFTVEAEGLPPGRSVEFQWSTVEATYVLDAGPEDVVYQRRQFKEIRVPLGRAVVDDHGRVTATFAAPEDYGEVHDVYAVVDGQDVARGGFRIIRTATMTPTAGPVGTPITIVIKGLGWQPRECCVAVTYDNKYVGLVTAVTTRGTAVFQIRAAGPPGEHVIRLMGGSNATPYLNPEQSPIAHIPRFTFTFNVTADNGPPPATLEWPETALTGPWDDGLPRTTGSGSRASAGVRVEPQAGPILSAATVRATGLTPGSEVDLYWMTAVGNRLSPSGWSLQEVPLARATVSADGTLTAPIQVPDGLGGWHAIKLVADRQVVGEAFYFVERSLVKVTPLRVRAGETFTVQIKGVGWTELDNGVAVTYDNAYMGFACGFNSNGDVTINLVATGGPGTHLIDLYPMVYRSGNRDHATEFWAFNVPFLTALRDHPGLALGYRLPIFRLAIEVVED